MSNSCPNFTDIKKSTKRISCHLNVHDYYHDVDSLFCYNVAFHAIDINITQHQYAVRMIVNHQNIDNGGP